jgi:hypothetical protein
VHEAGRQRDEDDTVHDVGMGAGEALAPRFGMGGIGFADQDEPALWVLTQDLCNQCVKLRVQRVQALRR